MKNKVNRLISLEVDSNELRAVELSGTVQKPKIETVGTIDLPEGVFSSDGIIDSDVFVQRFHSMLDSGAFKGKDVIVGINNPSIIMRLASFPKVDEDKQRNVILLQAQDFIPISIAELEIAYITFDEVETERGIDVNTLLIAAKSNMITSVVDTLQSQKCGGYIVNDVTLGVTSIASILDEQETVPQTYMLMYANAEILSILIVSNSSVVMARSVALEKETKKKEEVVAESSGQTATNLFGFAAESSNPENSFIQTLKNEFRASSNYFKIKNDNVIEKLYVYVQHKDIEKNISEFKNELGIDTEIVKIDRNIKCPDNINPDKYVGCICMALNRLG